MMDVHGANGDIPNAPDEGYCVFCHRQFKGKRGLLSHNVVHRKKTVVEEPLTEADWDENRTLDWEDGSILVAPEFEGDQALDPRGALHPPPIPARPNPVISPLPDAGGAKVRNEAAGPQKENVPKPSATPLSCPSSAAVPPQILQPSNHQNVLRKKTYNVKMAGCILDGAAAREEARLVTKPDVPLDLVVPYAMARSPFHNRVCIHSKIPLEASAAMGVNRVMQFPFSIPTSLHVPDNCLLIRFCSNPSQLYPSDKRPHNLALRLNDKDILRPETIDYRPTLKYQHAYSPVEVALDDIADSNILVIEWTVADKSLTEEFLFFLEISRKNTQDKICGDVSERKIGIDESAFRRFNSISPNSMCDLSLRPSLRPLGGLGFFSNSSFAASECHKAECVRHTVLTGTVYRALSKQDDDVSANSRTLSLICGLSLKRPEIPARGKHCRHPECFDLASFILMNHAVCARWLCPVCKGPVSFSDLVVDEFIWDLLEVFPYSTIVEVSAGEDMITVKELKKPEVKTTKAIEVVNVEDTITCG